MPGGWVGGRGWRGMSHPPQEAPFWPSGPLRGRQRIHRLAVGSFLKLRVVIPEVSVLPEDLEELYDLFKVGTSGRMRG